MNQINSIEVNNISKYFKVYQDKGSSLKERILFRKRNTYEKREVLRGISFNVKQGEAIGLIGENGCGKSTMLKILTRIMYPTTGAVQVKGRVSSLIELGAGFHGDMSGRENIYINSSVFGMTRKEIDDRIDDIIRFSELEDFIENPVRTYSSGMYMRLAFSVAINVNADVLLIDEILAVGDVNFQAKCFEKLKEIKAQGTTIIIVSHSLGQIERICDRSIWIKDGLIQEEGIPKYVHEHYLAEMEEVRLERLQEEFEARQEVENETKREQKLESAEEKSTVQSEIEQDQKEEVIAATLETVAVTKENKQELNVPSFCDKAAVRVGNHMVNFTNIQMKNASENECRVFKTGEKMIIDLDFAPTVKELKGSISVSISRDDGVYVYGVNTNQEKNMIIDFDETSHLRFEMEELSLLTGKYTINVGLYTIDELDYDVIWNAVDFHVSSIKTKEIGVYQQKHSWSI